ncbi:MAG: hypothetical protein LBR92_03005 [Puniceicoccales bacterium]|jgi:acetyl esterase/lipase|nr:hypothetical protein [Puniceicoccales bacterium]
MNTKFKTCVTSLLLLNALQFSALKLYGDPPPEQSSSEAKQDPALMMENLSPETVAFRNKVRQVEQKIQGEQANTSQTDIKRSAQIYSQKTANNLNNCKNCQNVNQAVQLSSAIENFQGIVDEFCNLVAPSLTSIKTELDSIIGTWNNNLPEAEKEKLERIIAHQESQESISLMGRFYNWEGKIRNELKLIQEIAAPLLYEPLSLKCHDPVITFETLITETDDKQLPMVVYSPTQKTSGEKLPCVIWLHGGSIASALKEKGTLHIESPEQVTPPLPQIFPNTQASEQVAPPSHQDWRTNNVSVGIQPLARFLASNGIVCATIEFDSENGKGNLRQQVKDQVEKIKTLAYIDTDKITFWGHSIGGYILSLLIANDPQFLIDNFKSGIAFVSPVLNEAWSGAIYFDGYGNNRSGDCAFQFATPDDRSISIENQSIGNYKINDLLKNAEHAQYILQCTYPFSPTCGMSDAELQPKLASLPPLFILMGTADSNTLPATQGATLAWRLHNMELTNWKILAYKNALHSPHRLKIDLNNPPSEEGFRQMLPNVLQIAQGIQPTNGTQDLSEISNGATTAYDSFQQQKPMKFFAERSFFMKLNANNDVELIPFGETECGQEILAIM